MRNPKVDDPVRLVVDIPEEMLHCGEIGVVRGTSCAPILVYEAEFHPTKRRDQTQAQLFPDQIKVTTFL